MNEEETDKEEKTKKQEKTKQCEDDEDLFQVAKALWSIDRTLKAIRVLLSIVILGSIVAFIVIWVNNSVK